jgi:hypothetical protein
MGIVDQIKSELGKAKEESVKSNCLVVKSSYMFADICKEWPDLFDYDHDPDSGEATLYSKSSKVKIFNRNTELIYVKSLANTHKAALVVFPKGVSKNVEYISTVEAYTKRVAIEKVLVNS